MLTLSAASGSREIQGLALGYLMAVARLQDCDEEAIVLELLINRSHGNHFLPLFRWSWLVWETDYVAYAAIETGSVSWDTKELTIEYVLQGSSSVRGPRPTVYGHSRMKHDWLTLTLMR